MTDQPEYEITTPEEPQPEEPRQPHPLQLPQYDLNQILEMRSRGITIRDIANELGCSTSTVCKYLRRAEAQGWEEPVPGEALPVAVAEANLPVETRPRGFQESLHESMGAVEKELRQIERQLAKAPKKLHGALRKSKLDFLGERRRQLELVLNALKTSAQIEQIRLFQSTVLEVLGQVDPEVRRKVFEELSKRAALVQMPDLE